MFGRRPDGRRIKGIDPIVAFAPYIMPVRSDAQVLIRITADFDVMTRYIRSQRGQGHNVTYMGLILAAYIRTVSQFPELNRFIMNKQLYARNHICVSFVTLKKNVDDEVEESLVKIEFDPGETIYEVSEKLEEAIARNREPKQKNKTDFIARGLMLVPMLPQIVVGLVRLLDRYGLMPRLIHEASPFHTSLFISNMASIGMNYIYHHIYNFGTTSLFVSMGKTEQDIHLNSDGSCRGKMVMPMGTVIDERICSGGVYARAFGYLRSCLSHPEVLEKPPESIKTETSFRKQIFRKGMQINA